MSRFDRNYTDEGYLMNYETPKISAPLKRQVLQFRIELEMLYKLRNGLNSILTLYHSDI